MKKPYMKKNLPKKSWQKKNLNGKSTYEMMDSTTLREEEMKTTETHLLFEKDELSESVNFFLSTSKGKPSLNDKMEETLVHHSDYYKYIYEDNFKKETNYKYNVEKYEHKSVNRHSYNVCTTASKCVELHSESQLNLKLKLKMLNKLWGEKTFMKKEYIERNAHDEFDRNTQIRDEKKDERNMEDKNHMWESNCTASPSELNQRNSQNRAFHYDHIKQGSNINRTMEPEVINIPYMVRRNIQDVIPKKSTRNKHLQREMDKEENSRLTYLKHTPFVHMTNHSHDYLVDTSYDCFKCKGVHKKRDDKSMHVKFNVSLDEKNREFTNVISNTTHLNGIKKKFTFRQIYNNYLKNKGKTSRQLTQKNKFGTMSSSGLEAAVDCPTGKFLMKGLPNGLSGEGERNLPDCPASRLSNCLSCEGERKLPDCLASHLTNGLSGEGERNLPDCPTSRLPKRLKLERGTTMKYFHGLTTTKGKMKMKLVPKNKLVNMFIESKNVYIKNLTIYPKEDRHKHVLSNAKNIEIAKREILSLPKKPIPLNELEMHKYKLSKNFEIPTVRGENEDVNFFKYKNTWYELFFYTSSGENKNPETLYNYMLMRLNFELLVHPIKDIVLIDENTTSFNYPYIYNAYLISPLDIHNMENSLRIQKMTSDTTLINNGSWTFLKKNKMKKKEKNGQNQDTENKENSQEIHNNERGSSYFINIKRNKYFIDHISFKCAKRTYSTSLKDISSLKRHVSCFTSVHKKEEENTPCLSNSLEGEAILRNDNTSTKVEREKTLPTFQKRISKVDIISELDKRGQKNHTYDTCESGSKLQNFHQKDHKLKTNAKDETMPEELLFQQKIFTLSDRSLLDCSCVYMTFGNSKIEPIFPYTCDNIFFLFEYYHKYINEMVTYFRYHKMRSKLLLSCVPNEDIEWKKKVKVHKADIYKVHTLDQGREEDMRKENINATKTQLTDVTIGEKKKKKDLTTCVVVKNEKCNKYINIGDINNFKLRNFINGKSYDSVFSHLKNKNVKKVKRYVERKSIEKVPIFLWVIFGGKDMKSMDSLNIVYKILRYATEIPPSEYEKYLGKLERRKIKKNMHTNSGNHTKLGTKLGTNFGTMAGTKTEAKAETMAGTNAETEAEIKVCWQKFPCEVGKKNQVARNEIRLNSKQEKWEISPEHENIFFQKKKKSYNIGYPKGAMHNSIAPYRGGKKKKKKFPELPKKIFVHKNLHKNAMEIYNRIVTYYEQYNKRYDMFGPHNYGEFLDYYKERVKESKRDTEDDEHIKGDNHTADTIVIKPEYSGETEQTDEDETYDFFIERSDSESSNQSDRDELFDFISYHMQGRNPSFEKHEGEIKEGKLNYTDIYGPLIYKDRKQKKKQKIRYSFLLLDYPAYNNSTGHPSPLTFKTSAFAALKEALKEIRKLNTDETSSNMGIVGSDNWDHMENVSINILGYSLGCCVSLQLLLDIAKSLYNDFFEGRYKTPFHRKVREPIKGSLKEENSLSIKLNDNKKNKINEYVYDERKILTFQDVLMQSASSMEGTQRRSRWVSVNGATENGAADNGAADNGAVDNGAEENGAAENGEEDNNFGGKGKVRQIWYDERRDQKRGLHYQGNSYLNFVAKNSQRKKSKLGIHKNGTQENAIKTVIVNKTLQSEKARKKIMEEILKNELKITVDRIVLVAPFTNTQKLVKSILSNSILFFFSWFVMNKKCSYVDWDNIIVLKEFFKVLNDLKKIKYLNTIFFNLQINFIHGEKDTLVNYEMSLKLYKLTNSLISKYALTNVRAFLYIFRDDCHSSIFNADAENKILQIIFKPLRLHPFSTTNIHKLHFSLYKDIYLLKTAYLQYIVGITSKLIHA
ncbi:hypothetical protein, conserved [Plasmodium gonderi]|uniref:Uncharacterized protein n=1 Tax=Plasmodium gonderi TaxID=77519 RepID=A0A1Y1JJU9_PLAGO|nr:hypothetical protein, conserved [Plasmodium gonderi]GAW81062.1 hypothetical protein, conserved [Plasmodium gonderi]